MFKYVFVFLMVCASVAYGHETKRHEHKLGEDLHSDSDNDHSGVMIKPAIVSDPELFEFFPHDHILNTHTHLNFIDPPNLQEPLDPPDPVDIPTENQFINPNNNQPIDNQPIENLPPVPQTTNNVQRTDNTVDTVEVQPAAITPVPPRREVKPPEVKIVDIQVTDEMICLIVRNPTGRFVDVNGWSIRLLDEARNIKLSTRISGNNVSLTPHGNKVSDWKPDNKIALFKSKKARDAFDFTHKKDELPIRLSVIFTYTSKKVGGYSEGDIFQLIEKKENGLDPDVVVSEWPTPEDETAMAPPIPKGKQITQWAKLKQAGLNSQ